VRVETAQSFDQPYGALVNLGVGLADHAQRRHPVPTLEQQIAQRGFKRLVNRLIQTQRAKHGVAAQACDDLAFARQDAGLRTAQQLIAAERYQVRAGPQAVGYQRLVDAERAQVHHAAAAQILV
jgi:hypothetical protein